MKNLFLAVFITFCLCASAGFAAEGEGGDKDKPKQEEKPRPDSSLSFVLDLPVVKSWSDYLQSDGKGEKLTASGEALKTVEGYECSGVAVDKTTDDRTTTWRRFCVTPGGSVWVESMPPDPDSPEFKDYETTYTKYDDWVKKCKPTNDSPGNC